MNDTTTDVRNQKVFIVGAGGMVGSTAAYALTLKQTVNEIVLIDRDKEMAEGQAMDISDAAAFTDGVYVHAGDYSELNDNDIVVITAGAAQKPGQSRLDLLKVNSGIMKSIVDEIMAQNKKPFIVVVANPVDVLTYEVLKLSGLPRNRVFGTGTTLESARLRSQLSSYTNVAASRIHAYNLGEHGDSSFSALSNATIGSIPLKDFPGISDNMLENIDKDVSDKVYKIINTKKATFYGIGRVIAHVVAALRRPQASVLPVCSLLQGEYGQDNVVLSVPSLVSTQGVQVVEGLSLDDKEKERLHECAEVLKGAIKELHESQDV